ncbi:hypothetical protein D1641_17110 [Colidextribacter sp. OB.20]|uniref:chitobiase/beta-hexosaminidase C-terminal domain-containing protein n=1 Tax=Colidextribacter sp. OB.20 TaxID=2304568 RepID=UPI00136FF825|nr:chitobiase/beta-hexosaminidase C-terminal domain-containing protein [Colidextribacter sp. OB.20]NBI11690.1 hypothetical protein [Colidextribacter sp. OB.20]
MKKRFLSALMALAVALTLLPASVLGAGAAPADEEVLWVAGSVEDDGISSDELLLGYLEQISFGDSGISLFADHSSLLSANAKKAYSALKPLVAKVANGTLASTKFNIGVKLDDEGDRKALMTVLMADCPYDLYWYDKTAGYVYSSDGSFSFAVAKAYATSKTEEVEFSGGVKKTYHFEADRSLTGAASNAVSTANKIVSDNAGKSDYDRLKAYKDEICRLVDYNDGAAADPDPIYGDPWQLIYVFDGDPKTKVVCEGYAKAFQYLCDLDDELACYTVSGVMSGGTGAGRHMWNIVTLGSNNYLVDVTNSDTGSIGQNGGLFLAGTANGSWNGTYTFAIPGQGSISFAYDTDIQSIYGQSVLKLATADYTYEAPKPTSMEIIDSDGGEPFTSLQIGSDAQYKARFLDQNGNTILVSDTDVDWKLSEGAPATFDQTTLGYGTPIVNVNKNAQAGEEFTLTATYKGNTQITAAITITVTDKPAESLAGATVTLGNGVLTYDGTPKAPTITVKLGTNTLTEGEDYTVLYNGEETAPATPGNVTVTIVGKGGYTGQATQKPTYTIGKATPTISAESVTVSVGTKMEIPVTLTGVETGDKPTGKFEATSSNTRQCDVDTELFDVVIKGVAKNEAGVTITIRYSGDDNYNAVSTTVKVIVTDKELVAESVTITGEPYPGQTLTASAVKPQGDTELTYTWECGGEKTTGTTYTVKPTDVGKKITVTVTDTADKYAPVSAEVTATAIPVEMTLTLDKNKVKYGTDVQATASVTANGEAIEDGTITYTSSNPAVAAIDATGKITTKEVADDTKVTITATFKKAGYEDATAEAELTVTSLPTIEVTADSFEKIFGDTAPFNLNARSKSEGQTISATFEYNPGSNGVVSVDKAGNVTINKAGTATITITAKAAGYHDGTATVTVTVAPKSISITGATVAGKTYDGTTDATVTNVTFDVAGIKYTATGEFADADAGAGKKCTVTVSLDNPNYTLTEDTFDTTATISKAALAPQTMNAMVSTAEGAEPVVIDLAQYLPKDCGGTPSYADAAVTDGKLTVNAAGTTVVTVSGMTNYEDLTITVNVTATDRTLVKFDIKAGDVTYDGKAKDAAVKCDPADAKYEVKYTGKTVKGDTYESTTAPTNAGSYKVTVSTLAGDTKYAGVAEATFEIKPAQVTVKADSMTIIAGQPLPEFTSTPKVDGVTVTCPSADKDLIGSYPIRISGPDKSTDGNYVYKYEGGTLYVSAINAPTASPKGGNYTGGQSVTLRAGAGATIYYTLDGTTPTNKSNVYARPISLPNATKTTTIMAIAVKDGAQSGVMTETYNITASSRPSGGGSSGGGGSGSTGSSVTVPVSGDQSSIRVDATVSGNTATVTEIDLDKIENVIGDDVRTGMVEIDFSGLSNTINTVKLPADAIGEIADAAKSSRNDVDGLTIKLSAGEISFDGDALAAIDSQSGSSVTLTMTKARTSDLNARQREQVGSAPVYDLTLKSGSKNITSFGNGLITVSLPYTLKTGEDASRIVVYYLDGSGNIQACETMYNVRTKSVIFTTTHLSLYYIGTAATTIVVEKIPASGIASASTQTVEVDGKAVEFQMYALLDANGNATNYIKLRDLAHVLNSTKATFSIGYTNETGITIVTGQPYQDNGSEMKTPFSGARAYTGGAQSVQINGKPVAMTAINLLDDNGGGYNYFKLRDLGIALGFNVSWTAERGVFVETDKPYVG